MNGQKPRGKIRAEQKRCFGFRVKQKSTPGMTSDRHFNSSLRSSDMANGHGSALIVSSDLFEGPSLTPYALSMLTSSARKSNKSHESKVPSVPLPFSDGIINWGVSLFSDLPPKKKEQKERWFSCSLPLKTNPKEGDLQTKKKDPFSGSFRREFASLPSLARPQR